LPGVDERSTHFASRLRLERISQDGENGGSLPNFPCFTARRANLTAASGSAWLALVVRSRHEKSVKTTLDSKGYRTALSLRGGDHAKGIVRAKRRKDIAG
jgi:hypothetical protein